MAKPKRGAYSRRKGNNYELQIGKELNELFKIDSLVTPRSESTRTDDAGIDIVDRENILPFHVQCKKIQNIPSVDLIKECKFKDKDLVIFWDRQSRKEKNCVSDA